MRENQPIPEEVKSVVSKVVNEDENQLVPEPTVDELKLVKKAEKVEEVQKVKETKEQNVEVQKEKLQKEHIQKQTDLNKKESASTALIVKAADEKVEKTNSVIANKQEVEQFRFDAQRKADEIKRQEDKKALITEYSTSPKELKF